jgi:hypothetical protein
MHCFDPLAFKLMTENFETALNLRQTVTMKPQRAKQPDASR